MHWALELGLKVLVYITVIVVVIIGVVYVFLVSKEIYYIKRLSEKAVFWENLTKQTFDILTYILFAINISSLLLMCVTIYLMQRLIN